MGFLKRLLGGDTRGRPAADAGEPEWPAEPVDAIGAVLAAIAAGRIGFATFVADPSRNYYVQVASAKDRGLVAEAVGNDYLRPGDTLDERQAATLGEGGWTLNGDAIGNWSMEFQSFPPRGSSRAAADALVAALTKVYGWRTTDRLDIRTGS